jgi:signal transduction histidine kinase
MTTSGGRRYGVRAWLALLAAAITSLVLVAFIVPLGLLVRSVTADRAVNAAASQAQALTSVVATASRPALVLTLEQVNASSAHPLTVFLPGGAVLGAPARRTAAVDLAARGRSFSAAVPGGVQILISVQGMTAGPAVISTFVPDADLHRGVARSWLILAALGAVLVLTGVVVADRLAQAMIRPATELSAVSHRLARGDLDARARPAGPAEIHDVAIALNHLAARIAELLHAERESAADLSHRLRTPLTALRLAAEAVHDPAEAQRVNAGVDALERAVSQSIHDARRAGAESATDPRCDAAAVVRDRVAFWSVLAEETSRDVRADMADGPLPARMTASDLAACVDTLLGNVFAHTPDGTAFAVTLTALPGGGARLVVADHGPGFPAPALAGSSVAVRGASGSGSTGLGLDIARRAAQAAGGSLGLGAAPGGGAQVTLELGPPESPQQP